MLQRDYLMRMLRELADLMTRASARRASGENEEALRDLEGAYRSVLGVDRGLLERLDAASVRLMLGSPEKADMAARLLREEAKTLRALGREKEADRREQRADALAPPQGSGSPV